MSAEATVLFDAPGPRARRLYAVIGAIGVLVLLVLLYLVYRGFADPANNQFTAAKWAPFVDPVTWTAYFIPGILSTLKAAGLAVVLAILLGVLLGLGRLSGLTPLRVACGIVVEFFRSVPVLVMMLFFYYFGQYALGISGDSASFFGVVAGLTFYNASVIAELVRSGVGSLPRGQREAGLALGLTPTQTLVAILLPQAVALMLPSIISQLVVILKDTALGYIIAYSELIRAGQNLSSFKGNLIPTLLVVAALFITINYALTVVARLVEKRLSARPGGPRRPPAGTLLNAATAPGAGPATVESPAVNPAPAGRPAAG
jgi:glutamate transport system permease protein